LEQLREIFAAQKSGSDTAATVAITQAIRLLGQHPQIGAN